MLGSYVIIALICLINILIGFYLGRLQENKPIVNVEGIKRVVSFDEEAYNPEVID